MICIYCKNPMVDLTHGKGIFRNYICHYCNAHLFKDVWRTKKEWDIWVNDLSEEEDSKNNG